MQKLMTVQLEKALEEMKTPDDPHQYGPEQRGTANHQVRDKIQRLQVEQGTQGWDGEYPDKTHEQPQDQQPGEPVAILSLLSWPGAARRLYKEY